MPKPEYSSEPSNTIITRAQIEQGIARARHLRAQAFADLISSVNRKIGDLGAAARRPKLSPTEPNAHAVR